MLPPARLKRDKRGGKDVEGKIGYQDKGKRKMDDEKKIIGQG